MKSFKKLFVVNNLSNPKTRTYHGLVGSGRTAGWRGGVGQDWVPTEQFAQETSVLHTPSIEETTPERISRGTNKRSLFWETKPAVDPLFISGSSAVYPQIIGGTRALFVPGCWPVERRFCCLCKPFSCKACPRKNLAQWKP